MVRFSLEYVARIVAPALLLAIAIDAIRRARGGRWHASLAWTTACLCILVGAVFPDVLSWLSTRLGVGIPPSAVIALGVVALVGAYGSGVARNVDDPRPAE